MKSWPAFGTSNTSRGFLDGDGVSDASVDVLSGMTRLKSIMLKGNGLSEEGVESIRQVLPNCRIIRLEREEPVSARGE